MGTGVLGGLVKAAIDAYIAAHPDDWDRDGLFVASHDPVEDWVGIEITAKPGMTLSYLTATTFSVSKGMRKSVEGRTIVAPSAITKSIASGWSAGSGNGAMDTGTVPISGTLHVYSIGKADGSWDILCSDPVVTTPGSPSMPSGWTLKRYIGSLLTDGSGNLLAWDQEGDVFTLRTRLTLVTETPATSANYITKATRPFGLRVLLDLGIFGSISTAVTGFARLYGYYEPDVVPAWTKCDAIYFTGYNSPAPSVFRLCNTLGQYHYRVSVASNTTVNVIQNGWIDRRIAFTGYE